MFNMSPHQTAVVIVLVVIVIGMVLTNLFNNIAKVKKAKYLGEKYLDLFDEKQKKRGSNGSA